jgi:hypothetical protein
MKSLLLLGALSIVAIIVVAQSVSLCVRANLGGNKVMVMWKHLSRNY